MARTALRRVDEGRLSQLPVDVGFWDGSRLSGRRPGDERHACPDGGRDGSVRPVVVARRPAAISHLLREPGELGLARAWVDGSLDVDGEDGLEAVLGVRDAFRAVHLGWRDRLRLALAAVRVAGPGVLRLPPIPEVEAGVGRRGHLSRDRDGGRRHSLSRDRTAVRHHYDLSNDFYRLVLGPSMVYSCAYFADPAQPLEAAQERKLDLICRKLDLRRGERLLDVGCGWGGLVVDAAARYGVRAVGVTLSEPQAEWARRRVRERGLQDRVEIRVADYRELADGPFHKIASVGMYEHVGRDQLERYVAHITGLLAPGGLFLNHGIARLHGTPPAADTFISRYVFPDGELHPVEDLIGAMAQAALEIRDVESLREHYPLTLRRWVANMRRDWAGAVDLVGSQRTRAWELYMLASAQAFEAGEITVFQVLAARGGAPHGLPLDRSRLVGSERAAG